MSKKIDQVVKVLQQGGVILYPTEGVWGLGCDPFNAIAARRLLKIKKRNINKGLILIAANWRQVKDLVQINLAICTNIKAKNKQPITWVFPATKKVPAWITGKFNSVAIRVTSHTLAKSLCKKFGGPVVSTSANLAHQKPAKYLKQVDKNIISQVDFILSGKTGTLCGPTTICDVITNKIIRANKV